MCVVAKQPETERLIVGCSLGKNLCESACVCLCVCICCCCGSLLLQPHPVCETLRRALSFSGCPLLNNYTHLLTTCKTAGGLPPNEGALQMRLRQITFIFIFISSFFFSYSLLGRTAEMYLDSSIMQAFVTVCVSLCVG